MKMEPPPAESIKSRVLLLFESSFTFLDVSHDEVTVDARLTPYSCHHPHKTLILIMGKHGKRGGSGGGRVSLNTRRGGVVCGVVSDGVDIHLDVYEQHGVQLGTSVNHFGLDRTVSYQAADEKQ
jgi:hypothetical protein